MTRARHRTRGAAMNIFSSHLRLALCAFLLHHPYASAAGDGFSEKPSNVSAHIGGEAILRCAFEHNPTNPPVNTQWRINSGVLLGNRDAGPIPGYDGRYSYVRDGQDELHLKIEQVSMENDGRYECQMVRNDSGQFRAAAFVNVVVAPESIVFADYMTDAIIDVNEGTPLNVSCRATSAKPAAEMRWYLNGRLVTDEVSAPSVTKNSNHTESTFSSVKLKPSKNDHNKVLTCEGVHPQSSTEKRANVTLNVLYSSERPKVNIIGGKDGIKAGHNVTMVCSAEGGNPPPRLYWLLENREINSTFHYDVGTNTTRSNYSFVAEGSDNDAVYECASVNRGNVPPLKQSVTLEVEYVPYNVNITGSTTVRRGKSVVVSCASSPSNPPSTISWLQNGATTMAQPQVKRSEGRGIVTESNFTVDSNTFPSGVDQLRVECVATNNEGSESQQHIIRVMTPPTHLESHGLERGPTLEGELLNLTCEAHGGNPLATLAWYRGVEKVLSAIKFSDVACNTPADHLKDTQSTVSGDIAQSTVSVLLDRSMNAKQIRCEAENGALDQPLVAAHTLSVLFPPRRVLVRQPETDRRQMIAGEATRLSCEVPSANPAPEITWEFESGNANQPAVKHGEYLYNRTVPEYAGYEVENVVTFTPTEGMDGTLARCIALHPMWNEAKSQTYRLNVFYAPRIVMDEPVTITVTEGESFRENVTIFANPPVSSHRWRKNGVAFDTVIRTIHVQGPEISGKAVTPQDSGFYTLVVANRFGSANVSIRLIVEYSARITYVTSPVTAGAGEDVALECEADGVPLKQGMVKWMRGNSVLKSVQDDKRAVLRLNASHDSSGAYTCMADNGVGQPNYTTAYLLVKRAPVLLRNPGYDRAAGPIGGRATLRCRAIAVPTARILWTLESGSGARGEDILYNTSKHKLYHVQLDHSTIESTLHVVGLEERDYSRRVRCRVHNRLGDDHAFITIGPPTAPDIPSQVEALSVKNTSAILRWQPGFDGGSDQLFEIRYSSSSSGVKSLNSSSSQITLTGLEPAEPYRVQIRSINMQGRTSTFSAPMEFVTLTKEGTPPPPRSLASTDGLSLWTIIIIGSAALLVLGLLVYFLVWCCYLRKRDQRKLKETDSVLDYCSNQPVAGATMSRLTYGSMGTPVMSHRVPSAATNRSEVYHESEEDAAKTVIVHSQVDMYGQPVDYRCIPASTSTEMVVFDERYAPFPKPSPVLLRHGSTYTHIPNPEPPVSMSQNYSPPSMRHFRRAGTLGRRDVRPSSSASSSHAAVPSGSIVSYESGHYAHMSPASQRNIKSTYYAAPPTYASQSRSQNAYVMGPPIGGSFRTSTDPSLPEDEGEFV